MDFRACTIYYACGTTQSTQDKTKVSETSQVISSAGKKSEELKQAAHTDRTRQDTKINMTSHASCCRLPFPCLVIIKT
jgi:hypothetical protein